MKPLNFEKAGKDAPKNDLNLGKETLEKIIKETDKGIDGAVGEEELLNFKLKEFNNLLIKHIKEKKNIEDQNYIDLLIKLNYVLEKEILNKNLLNIYSNKKIRTYKSQKYDFEEGYEGAYFYNEAKGDVSEDFLNNLEDNEVKLILERQDIIQKIKEEYPIKSKFLFDDLKELNNFQN